jgi:hypothetical protein
MCLQKSPDFICVEAVAGQHLPLNPVILRHWKVLIERGFYGEKQHTPIGLQKEERSKEKKAAKKGSWPESRFRQSTGRRPERSGTQTRNRGPATAG